jgi:hypothetical protein
MKQDEKKLYQNNILGYNLVMGFIILNTIYTIFTLKSMELNYNIGIFIMLNIVLSLLSFLDAVKVKSYSIMWSYITFFIGIFQILRFLLWENKFFNRGNIMLGIIYLLSIFCIFLSSFISLIRSKKRQKYINNNIDTPQNVHDTIYYEEGAK